MGGLVMILALSSLFSSLGVVMVLMVFKVSLVEAKIEARCGICILSTFSSGLQGRIFVFVFVYLYLCIFVFVFPVTWRQETQGAKLPRWSPCQNLHVEESSQSKKNI